MAKNHRDTLRALEQKCAAKRDHLRDTLTAISGSSPMTAAGSYLRVHLSGRARAAAREIEPRFRGQFGLWATALIGSGLAFEFGRASVKSKSATMPSEKLDETARSSNEASRVSGATMAPPARSISEALRFYCLAIGGIASGFFLSAAIPRMRGEAALQASVSKHLTEQLREFLGANCAGLVRVASNATGLSRFGAIGVVLVHLMIQVLSRRPESSGDLADEKFV